MKKLKARKLISLSAIVVLTAALITCTALFAAGVFSVNDNPLIPSDGGLNGGTSSSQLNFGVFGATSTETGTVGQGYTASGTAISSGTEFRNQFTTSTNDISTNLYLANDITLSADQFGSLSVFKSGYTFDGNGKTITVNLSNNSASPKTLTSFSNLGQYSSNVQSAGLFGKRVQGTVKNVIVVINGHLRVETSSTTGTTFGLISGWVDGTVENVHVILNGSAVMENTSSTTNSDIAFGGIAGVAGGSSTQAKFYNVKFTLNGEFCGKSANAGRHIFAGGIIGLATNVDLNYAHFAGNASGMMALRGSTGWRMMGGIIGTIRRNSNSGQTGVGSYFVQSQTGAIFKNIILTYEGEWTCESSTENYQGAAIGVAYDQKDDSAFNTNNGTGVSFLLVTNYQTSGNLHTSPGPGSSAENKTGNTTRRTTQLYAVARTNADCAKHVSVNMKETVLGVAYNANGGTTFANRLKGITATMQGWIATGISNLSSSSVGSFVADTSNPSMGGYFQFSSSAATTSGVNWKWETTYQTEDIGSVPNPDNYSALGTGISTAAQFTSIFGATGTVYGNYYLVNNIELPSGYTGSGVEFNGTLDGRGRTVTVAGTTAFSTGATYNSKKVTGGIIGVNKGSIYNLKVKLSGTVSVASSFTDCIAVGGVAGLNSGLIKNVEVTVEQGAVASFAARNGAIAVGGIVGINGGNVADLYNSRVQLAGDLKAEGSGSYAAIGGAIGVMLGGNVNAVELVGQGVLSAGTNVYTIPVAEIPAEDFETAKTSTNTLATMQKYPSYVGTVVTDQGLSFQILRVKNGSNYLNLFRTNNASNNVSWTPFTSLNLTDWKPNYSYGGVTNERALTMHADGTVTMGGVRFVFPGAEAPATAHVGGVIGAVNPGDVNSQYPGTGAVSIDNLFLNYYGELSAANSTTKVVGAAVGYIKVSSQTSVKAISSYPRPLENQNVNGRIPSTDGLGGIAALGSVTGSASAVNPIIYVQYADYSLIYGGSNEFKGITARYGNSDPQEIEGISRVSHDDKIIAEGSGEDLVVTIMPTDGVSYSWEWKRIIHWNTVDTAAKFLQTFYQDANDGENDGVVNGYYKINGEISLMTSDFANLTPKIIGENAVIDGDVEGLGTSIINLNRANYEITPTEVAAGSDYPNEINAAGILASVNRGKIKNLRIVVSGTVSATKDASLAVGGVAGINLGTILNCTVEIRGNGAINAGVSGSGKADVALGGTVGINHGANAVISASSAQVDGTLSVTGLAANGNAAVGGVIGVLGYSRVNTFNTFKGGGNIGIATATNSTNYAETLGGIVGSAQNSFENTDGTTGFADANTSNYSRVIDYSIFDFSGKYLKASALGTGDYYGVIVGRDADAASRTAEKNEGFYTVTYSKHMFVNDDNMSFVSGKADATNMFNLIVGDFAQSTHKDYYKWLRLTVDDCEFGTDYNKVEELTTRVTVSYCGSELVWGMDTSLEKTNCDYDNVKGEIYLFGKNQTITYNTGGRMAFSNISFSWSRPKPFEGETATGDTKSGTLMGLEVPDYTDGWATDYGRIMAGYGIPTDAYAINSDSKFREWLNLSEDAEGYSYGYLTQNLSITNSLAGTITTLQAGRTFDGAGRTITFGSTSWLRPSSAIITNTLAAYGGSKTVNSKVAIRGGIIAVNQGTIKNLSMYMGATTITWASADSGSDTGGLMGAMVGLNNGLIENCSIKINSGGTSNIGDTENYGFIVHKQGRTASDRTILSVGGLVGANVNGTVRYSGAVINGSLKACNGDGGANNKYPTCFVGGVIGMQSGGTAEYLTVRGNGAIVNLSGATESGKFTSVGGIIGVATIGGSYNSGSADNDFTLAASSLGRMHSDFVGYFCNTGSAYLGRTVGYLRNNDSTKVGGFSAYNDGAFPTAVATRGDGWVYSYTHGNDTTRPYSTAPLYSSNNTSQSATFSGGAVWVQKNGSTVSPATGFYNTYFDYWTKDTILAIEFEHPAAISSVSGTRVSGTVTSNSRCVVDESFYTGTDYTASVNASMYTLASDALAFGNMRSTDTRNTSGTQITSGTSLPLSGGGTYYLNGDTTITLAENNNNDSGTRQNKTSMLDFYGNVDGNGHTLTIKISSRYVKLNASGMYGIGLLVDKMSGGNIRNLKLVVSITGEYKFTRWYSNDQCFGPLVGYMTDGTIDNVKVTTSGNICADTNIAYNKFGLGGMIGRMTGGTVKNSLAEMNATLNITPGTTSFEIDYVFGGIVGHLSGGTLSNVALSGSGRYTYSHEQNKKKFIGLVATVIKGQETVSSPTINGVWLIDCSISIDPNRYPDTSGILGGIASNGSFSDRYLSYSLSNVYRSGTTGSGGWFASASSRSLHFYEGNLDFSKYTGNQEITGATLPTGGDNVGGVSNYSLYIDRALVFDGSYNSIIKAVVRNNHRGFVIVANDKDTTLDHASVSYDNPANGSTKLEMKSNWKIAQKGKLYLTDGNGEKKTSSQTASKEFDGSNVATMVKENDPDKYAWTYTIFDWSGSFPLAWSAQGETGGAYDPVIRLSSAMPGTSETVSASSRLSNGFYFNDPAGRYVKSSYYTPVSLTYSITQTTLIVNPVTSPGWDETRSANFIVPRGETGSIVQLVFYEDTACSMVAFQQGFDTYEYAANMGINLVIERQSAVGGSVYYVIAYFKDENSSGDFAAICAPTAIQVDVDNADPVISLADTVYIPDGEGRFTAEKTITVTDVSPLTYTILTQPTVAVNVQSPRYGVYVLSFAETAEVNFSVVDSVGREASVDFLIDVEAPQMSLEFNTRTYTDESGSIQFINSNGHQINIQTLSDNYVDEHYLAEHFFWRVTDLDGTVLYTGKPADFNLSTYILSLNFDTPVHFANAILEVWTEDSVGHRTSYSIGGGEGGAARLLIDTRTYSVSVSSSHIYKEGNPLPYTSAPQLRITDAVTGLNRTANMGSAINLRRFDTITVANANASAGFTYLGFGADVNNGRIAGNSNVINPADESLDTEIYGTNSAFVIDGQPRNGAQMGTTINLMLFYRLMLKVKFDGQTIRNTDPNPIVPSSLVGAITRSTGQTAIATADYIEVTVRGEDNQILPGNIDGNQEKIYTVSFDIRDEYANYYEIDTDSATTVLSIVNPADPILEFNVAAVNLTYATTSDGFIGEWEDETALGWAIVGENGLVNTALKRSTITKNATESYPYTQFLAEYKTKNGADFYSDFNYTVRQGTRVVSLDRILDAGSYSITVYIRSGKGFVGSFTLNITVGKKTVYAYAFSQETIYGNGLYTSGYFVDWKGERASDGGVLAADRTEQTLTYKLVGEDVIYEIPERGIKVKIGTFADGKINLAVGGTTKYSLNASLSGNTLTVGSFAFADGAYTTLPQASSSRTNVGSFNGVISLDGGNFKNYNISATNAPNLTINQRPITIVIADTTKGYNTADPANFNWAPSATEGLGFAPGDNAGSFVAILSRAEGETVGQSYTISGTFTNSNYDITVVNGKLTVVKLQLQYILTGLNGAFCDDVTDYLGTITAMIRNANAADSLTATVVYRVGFDLYNNPIFIGRDYRVLTMNADGSFTLEPNAAVVRQNGNNHEFYGKTAENGPMNWYSISWTKEGNYVFRVLVSSSADNKETVLGNYAYDNTEDRAFTISPRPITLVVFDQTVRYGDSVNSTGGLNSTFKLQGVPSGVTISQDELNQLAVNKDRAAVFVGQYTSALYINNGASVITLHDTNGRSYAVSVVRGNLTIEKRELTITWSNSVTDTLVYNGTNQKDKIAASINASSAVSNIVSGDNRYLSLSLSYYNVSNVSVSSITNAGGYYVKATLNGDRAGNYYLNPVSETKYVNIDKATAEIAFFGNDWNESKNALPYIVFNGGGKNSGLFGVSSTNKNTNIYVSSQELLGSSNANFNTKWVFTIITSSGTGWSENKYTGWDNLPTTIAAGTYEMWVDAPETANYYGVSGRCMFVIADQTGTPPGAGEASHTYNQIIDYNPARFYTKHPTKTIVIKEGTTTLNFSSGYGGFVGADLRGGQGFYGEGAGVTLSNGGGSLDKRSSSNYTSITWGYIYANIELSPELYMALQNGNLTLSINVTAKSDHYVYNTKNYNNADATQVIVKEIKNSSYYGFGRSDVNEEAYDLHWTKENAISKLTSFYNGRGVTVNRNIHDASNQSYNATVTQEFNATKSSAYRVMLCAVLHADDWDTGANYTGMNVQFSNVSITATVNDNAAPTIDSSTLNAGRAGTGLVVSSSKTVNGVTERYNDGAKYYQITVKDSGVGVNPYTFRAVFGRQGKSDLTYTSAPKTGTSANLIGGVKALTVYGNTTGNTVDYRTVVFQTPFLSSDVTSLKSIEVEDFKGNKLRQTFTDRTIDVTAPVISSITIDGAAFDEGKWYSTGKNIRFTVTDTSFNSSNVKLYYYEDGTRRDVGLRHTGSGVFDTNQTLTKNTLYYIEAWDSNYNKTVRSFYFHIDPQSETTAPPLTFDVEVSNGFVIESDFESAANSGRWNTGSIEITATIEEPQGGMGDGLGKFEYLALDYTNTDELAAYNSGNYKGDTYADRWRALSLEMFEDGTYYFSTLTLSTQQQKLYVMRFVTEAGNVIYKPVGLVRIDSVVPQIFGTVADMNGKLAESGKWVGKGIIFNISGVNGLSKGTLQYMVETEKGAVKVNWTSAGFSGDSYVVTDSYFAGTLIISNQTVNGDKYSFRFLPGSGDENQAVYLKFGDENFFNVRLDYTPPQIETSTSDWQADQSTAVILTSDIGSGVADVIVFELDEAGNKENYFTTTGAYSYAVDAEGNLTGTPIADTRRVVYESGEYRFDFGAKSYVIRAVDAVGNMTEEAYKPQIDDVVPEFDISVISYDNIDNVGFNFIDVVNLVGTTPAEVFGEAANFNKGFEIANGKKVLFVSFNGQKYVGFSGGTGVNYTLYDGTSDRTFGGTNAPVAGLGFANVELKPHEARVRATSSDGSEIYNVIDPAHSYENGLWTTDTVRFILTGLKVGKSGGTLYYSNNGMSDITSDWIPVYTVGVNVSRPDSGETIVNLSEFVEAAGDRYSTYTFRFVSLSGVRVYYNFEKCASEERDAASVTDGDYNFAVNIDTTAPEIYGVEYRMDGTAFWSAISALSVADWFTANVNIRFKVNDLFTTAASSGIASVILTEIKDGQTEDIELTAGDDGYYTFVITETAGYTITATDGVGSVYSYNIEERKVDTVPLKMEETVTSNGNPYVSSSWATSDVVFEITTENGLSGGTLTYSISGTSGLTEGLELISERLEGNKVIKVYRLTVSEDVEYTEYSFTLENAAGNAVYSQRTTYVRLDKTLPEIIMDVIQGTLPTGDTWSTTAVTLGIRVSDETSGVVAGSFAVTVDGAPLTLDRNDRGQYVLPVSDMREYVFYVSDNAGNVNEKTVSFNIDATPPVWSATTPIEAYVDYGTANQAAYDTTVGDWSVKPVTLVFNVKFNATAERAGVIEYSTDNVTWKTLFACGDEKYRVENKEDQFVYTFKDGEELSDVNGIFAFRAKSLSGIVNEGENPTGYKLKVDQTTLSISAEYLYANGAAWTTPWANRDLKARFDAVYGISGATLQVSTDGGANWTDVKRYENDAKVEDFVIMPSADIGNYIFRLVKGASASVTAQTDVELVRFDTAEPELSLAAVNTASGTKYSKGSWSGEGVTFRFTLVMGASYADTNFLFSNDNGQTFTYMWRTENGALADGYAHGNLSGFSVSEAVGEGLDARYTVTFSYSVTEEIIQTRFMFAVNYETQDTEVRGNGYYRLDRSFNDVNSVRIDRVKSVFLEVDGGNKVTVLKSDNSDYDYSAIGNWYNGNVTFTFAVRSYASGGSLRYSVGGAALTSESVIRGAVTRGVDSEGRTYADTVYTLTLNSTVNAEFKFVAQSTAGLETWFDSEDGNADGADSFFVSIDKNMPTLINNNLSYYRDTNGNGSYDVAYAPSTNSYVSDDGVLAVFAISDGDSGVDISGISVTKDGENVAVSPYDGDGRYSFMITDSSTYTLTVRDNAGNTIVRSFRIGVDSVKPTLAVSVVNDGFSADNWITDALEFRFVGTEFGSSGGFIEYSTDGVNFRTAGSAVDVFALPEIYFAGDVVFRAKSHAGRTSDEQTFTVKVDRQDYNINIAQYVGSFIGNYADVMLSKQAPYKRGDTVDIAVIARRPYSFAAYEVDGGARTEMNGGETFTVSFTGDGDITDKEVVLRFGEELTLSFSNLKQSVQFNGISYDKLISPVMAITAAGNNLTSYLTVDYLKDGVSYKLSELGVFYSGTELIKRLGEFDIIASIANTDYTIKPYNSKLNICYFGETGSENDPFVLNYEEDFAFLSEAMYTGNYYFVLGKDVTINDPNARVKTTFTGHLDGKNHVITLGAQLAENGMAGGLFRKLDGATVSNIGFRMFETKIDLQSGNTTFGTLADTAIDSTVNNVYVIADYTAVGNYEGDFAFGGLVGTAKGMTSFDNVYTDASFVLTGLRADGISVGGVYGTADESVTVENSYSVAVIRANDEEGVSAGMFGGDGREVGPSNEAVASNVYIGGRWVADTGEGATIVSYANLYNGTNYVLNSRYSGIAAPVRVGDVVKIRFNSDFYGAYSVIGDRVVFEVSEFNGFNAIDKYLWAEFTQTADFALGQDEQSFAGLIARYAEFRGVYDGNGFSIELAAKANGSYALFDTVRGEIKNVTLSDISVDVTLDEAGFASVLVGTLRGGTVGNVVVGGTLKVNAENSSDEVTVAIIAATVENGAEIYDVLVSALMTVDANLLELGAVAANLEEGRIDNAIVISTVNATVDKRASLGAIAGMVSGTSEITNAYALSGNTYLDGSSYDVLIGYDRTTDGVMANYTDFDTVMTRNNYYLDGRDVSDVLREQFENEFEGGGVGTVTDPFVIENAQDFNKISRYMFANYEIRPMIVGADGRKVAANYLDFGTGFETIGRGMIFTGSLRGTAIDDGNGGWVWVTLMGVTDSIFDINYGTISILNITANVSKRLTGSGTFGLIANENYGTIRQVDITGNISVSTSSAIDMTVGAVVGKNVGGNLSEIIVSANVTVRGIRVTAGLIAGEVSGSVDEAIVTNCLAEAVLKVTGNFVTAGVYVGSLDSPSLMDVANITSGDARLNLNVKG